MPILIARPEPAEPGDHGNWRLPSLLGRDFLRHFRFELFCGERREAALETLWGWWGGGLIRACRRGYRGGIQTQEGGVR